MVKWFATTVKKLDFRTCVLSPSKLKSQMDALHLLMLHLLSCSLLIFEAFGQCGTSYSCVNQTLTSGGELLGYKSGYFSRVDYSNRIYVKGTYGLAKSPSIKGSASPSLSCYSVHGCAESIVETDNDVECHSGISCVNTQFNTGGGIHCWGEASCLGANITGSADYISVYGAYGLMNANINVDVDVNIHLCGFNTGYNATINCASATACSLTCWTNACANLHFNCNDLSSDCSVDCSNTEERYCPTYSSSTNNYDDSSNIDFFEFYTDANSNDIGWSSMADISMYCVIIQYFVLT